MGQGGKGIAGEGDASHFQEGVTPPHIHVLDKQ